MLLNVLLIKKVYVFVYGHEILSFLLLLIIGFPLGDRFFVNLAARLCVCVRARVSAHACECVFCNYSSSGFRYRIGFIVRVRACGCVCVCVSVKGVPLHSDTRFYHLRNKYKSTCYPSYLKSLNR